MKFEVYKDGKLSTDFVLHGASLFGADRIPFRNTNYISLDDGLIECRVRGSEPAGLALLWEVAGFGNVLAYTTRLPERDEPYILNIELARAKLMEIVIKREDWSIFEQNAELAKLSTEVQGVFAQTLASISDPAKASVLADKCLQKAMVFSELVATKYADVLFEARLKNRGFSRSSLGCRVNPDQLGNKNYLKGALELFAHIGLPVNWAKIESKKGEYDFSDIDKCIEAFGRRRLLLTAGPLLRFEPGYIPEWLTREGADFEKIREVSYEFISKIVTRYAKYVHIWQVVSGMNAYNHFKFSFERVLEITRTACLAAREADNRSLKMIEIISPWGEYYAHDHDTIPPLVYVDMITQAGINFDALGVQMVFGKDSPGMHVRDMMQVSSMLDKFITVPKPLHITSVSVPDGNGTAGQGVAEAGMWHKPWNQGLQGQWINDFCRIAFSKPYVNSISYSNFADSDDDVIAGSGLLTGKMQPKKAFMAMAKMQKQILQKA